MLNPYTLKPEPSPYRDDSTMAIAIRKEQAERYVRRFEKREAVKSAIASLFKRDKP